MKKIRNFFCLIAPVLGKRSVILIIEVLLEMFATFLGIVFPLKMIEFILYEKALEKVAVWSLLKLLTDLLLNSVKKRAEYERKLINCRIEYRLSEKMLSAPFAKSQSKTWLDKKSGACFSVEKYKTVDQLLRAFNTIFCQCIVLIFGGSYLLFSNPILLGILLLMVGVQVIVNRWLNNQLRSYFKNLFPINRRFEWLSHLKTDLGRQKDIRVFHMKDMILQKMSNYNQETCAIFQEMNDITYRSNMTYQILAEILHYLAYFYNGFCVFAGKITFGEFLMLNELVGKTTRIFATIGNNVTSGFQLLDYMEPVFEVMEEETVSEESKNIDRIEKIEFDHVYFSYPDMEKEVLKDISFCVHKGEKIGIVGLNASGKTTLVKLICGFYVPSKGSILVNDKPIEVYDKKSYQKMISAIFQDFKVFDFSVEENIVLNEKKDQVRLNETIYRTGLSAFIDGLIAGLNTNLGAQTHPDGVDCSGGERQKLAIARAAYRKGHLFLFDEPAANLDPVSEAKVYQQYNQMTGDHIAFYISHKMITTSFCTKLLILEDGRMTGFATLDDLLQNHDSLFYQLFMQQKAEFVDMI